MKQIVMCKELLDRQRHPENGYHFVDIIQWKIELIQSNTSVERGGYCVVGNSWGELWCAKDNWIGWDILNIIYQSVDIVQWKNLNWLKAITSDERGGEYLSENLISWSELWWAKDN